MRKSALRCSGLGLALLLPCLTLPSRALACVVGTGMGASCTEAALNACLPGGGSFDGKVTFNCGGAATITVTSTETISADTTIEGGSLITISGGNSVGVFSVNTGVKFTVQNLTIANGNSGAGFGGGIATGGINGDGSIITGGTVTVTNCTFSNNSAGNSGGGAGGGIFSTGTLTVTNSTFSDNSAVGHYGTGGAIASTGTLTVINSTFSDNSAGDSGGGEGGGIVNSGGTLMVTNSTFAGNRAFGGDSGDGGDGGGIQNTGTGTLTVTNSTFSGNSAGPSAGAGGGIKNHKDGTLAVTNSTFAGNSAGEGGGIYNDAALTVSNTIVANSTSGGNCGGNGDGAVTDGGHNIDDDGSCGFSTGITHPQLDPAGLKSHGGPTQTIALEPGSPAVDAGDESVCAVLPVNNLDQRGYGRPGAGATRCSIGAYEYNAGPSGPTPTPTPSASTCVGDCDGSGDVTVNEIITLVTMALGSQTQLSACPHGIPADITDVAQIDVTLIIQAVTNALTGCGGH
jgi:predicted outer membrane repeat protein